VVPSPRLSNESALDSERNAQGDLARGHHPPALGPLRAGPSDGAGGIAGAGHGVPQRGGVPIVLHLAADYGRAVLLVTASRLPVEAD
jgi:hypothetical protein